MRRLAPIVPPALLAAVLLTGAGCATVKRKMAERAAHRPPYAKISAPVAFEMIRDSPDILILDLRDPQAFNGDTGHLFRARSFPLARLPYRLLEISAYRDDTFLVYCDSTACAEDGMGVLISSGFEDAVLMDGGIDAWIKTGYRTVLPSDVAGRAAERAAAARRPLSSGAPPAASRENAAPPP
jgi:rhodanese-related sulfurtransferase